MDNSIVSFILSNNKRMDKYVVFCATIAAAANLAGCGNGSTKLK